MFFHVISPVGLVFSHPKGYSKLANALPDGDFGEYKCLRIKVKGSQTDACPIFFGWASPGLYPSLPTLDCCMPHFASVLGGKKITHGSIT